MNVFFYIKVSVNQSCQSMAGPFHQLHLRPIGPPPARTVCPDHAPVGLPSNGTPCIHLPSTARGHCRHRIMLAEQTWPADHAALAMSSATNHFLTVHFYRSRTLLQYKWSSIGPSMFDARHNLHVHACAHIFM
jgi:hypothetical protein